MKHEYYLYVSIGYTGRYVKVSKKEFVSFVEMVKSKFDYIVSVDECSTFKAEKWYAFVDYGVKDGIVSEQFALMKTLK